jgi:methionyl-tRNA synthetase
VERLNGDLCISRPKSRLDWGIELPFDKDFVTYVWFDALTNYISFVGYDPNASAVATGLRPVGTDASSESFGTAHRAVATSDFDAQPREFLDRWPALQIIGKDILVPAHGIYWLIMLHAIGFPDDQMPQLLVHGWWNLGGAKMSKSAGNIIDPFVLADKYGDEALRYYLVSEISTGGDADFSEERLVARHNADLANSLGNLLNRTLTMAAKYRESRITFSKAESSQNRDEHAIESYAAGIAKEVESYKLHMSASGRRTFPIKFPLTFGPFAINAAIRNILEIASRGNMLVEDATPWKLAKSSDEASKVTLNSVLYELAETLRITAILISPVLPKSAHRIFDQLNWKMELSRKEKRFSLADAEWGRLPDGHVVGKPVPLFPRIETIKL